MGLPRALIGYSGFVGSTLMKQTSFDMLYRSTNISEIKGQSFSSAVCAAAPAQKWLANKHPNDDRATIDRLITHLEQIDVEHFILISTVDVFASPSGVTEETQPTIENLHPYGLNRLRLEHFVREKFSRHLIVRLPGLVGPGLRKNVLFDLKHNNNVDQIDRRGVFQYYPMVNLWSDIRIAIKHELELLHLTAEPIATQEIAQSIFDTTVTYQGEGPAPSYDFRTIYGALFQGNDHYQYTKKEVLLAIRAYAQCESA